MSCEVAALLIQAHVYYGTYSIDLDNKDKIILYQSIIHFAPPHFARLDEKAKIKFSPCQERHKYIIYCYWVIGFVDKVA